MTGGTLEPRLAALQAALQQAVSQQRIGTPRAFHWLVQCRVEDLTPMIEGLLASVDDLLACQRSRTHILENASGRMALALWARGQTATISAGATLGAEFIDLVVLGSAGTMAYRRTGGGHGAL